MISNRNKYLPLFLGSLFYLLFCFSFGCSGKSQIPVLQPSSDSVIEKEVVLDSLLEERLDNAYRLYKDGELDSALALCEITLPSNPDYPRLNGYLAELTYQLGDMPRAVSHAKKALRLDDIPYYGDGLFVIAAIASFSTQQPDSGMVYLDSVLSRTEPDSTSLNGLQGIANWLLLEGFKEAAFKTLGTWAELCQEPCNDTVYAKYAKLAITQAEPSAASAILDRYTSLSHSDSTQRQTRREIALWYYIEGFPSNAASQIFHILSHELIPADLSIYTYYLEQLSHCSSHWKQLENLINAHPSNRELRVAKAECLRRTGVPLQARDEYQELLKIYPHDIDVLHSLAFLEYEQRNYTTARELLMQLKQTDYRPAALYFLGLTCEYLGRFDEALANWREFKKVLPSTTRESYH